MLKSLNGLYFTQFSKMFLAELENSLWMECAFCVDVEPSLYSNKFSLLSRRLPVTEFDTMCAMNFSFSIRMRSVFEVNINTSKKYLRVLYERCCIPIDYEILKERWRLLVSSSRSKGVSRGRGLSSSRKPKKNVGNQTYVEQVKQY